MWSAEHFEHSLAVCVGDFRTGKWNLDGWHGSRIHVRSGRKTTIVAFLAVRFLWFGLESPWLGKLGKTAQFAFRM
jgi:hypothetical protein